MPVTNGTFETLIRFKHVVFQLARPLIFIITLNVKLSEKKSDGFNE